jgi:taurine--2-oxoglutarate transaminase
MYTGKNKIISRYRSYHGSTMGSIAATGDPRRWAMEPAGKIAGVVFAPETTATTAPSSTPTPAATSPAPTTSST